MSIDNIINNNIITDTVQDMYRFIEQHEESLTKIFEDIFDDLKSQFTDISKENKNCIIIKTKDLSTIDKCENIINDCVSHHFNSNLECNYSNIINYIFKVVTVDNYIKIIKKR